MKTKVLFYRYPRKISLLKDLPRGYSGTFPLRKSMKTGSKLRYPSKNIPFKGLKRGVSEERGLFLSVPGACCGKSRIVKELKEPLLLSNS
jgi:hypothetical protein